MAGPDVSKPSADETAKAAEAAHRKAESSRALHPSALHLSQLTNILNARDLAEASPVLKTGACAVLLDWLATHHH